MDALVNAEEAPPGARFCNDLADRYVVRRWGEINGRVMGIVATETYAKCLVTGEVSRVYGEDADVFETSGHKEFGERWMYHVYDRRAWEEAGSVPGREKDYEFKRAFLYDIEVVTI